MSSLLVLALLCCRSSSHYYVDVPVLSEDDENVPCHGYGGPRDRRLRCDPSPHQIVFDSNNRDQTSKQKRNLIIFDVDLTILESMHGFHAAIPPEYRQNGTQFLFKEDMNLEMMFVENPCPFSVLFRNHFLDILEYIHTDFGFSADIVLYTRARCDYAMEIALGIIKCYNLKYNNDSDNLGMFCIHSPSAQL